LPAAVQFEGGDTQTDDWKLSHPFGIEYLPINPLPAASSSSSNIEHAIRSAKPARSSSSSSLSVSVVQGDVSMGEQVSDHCAELLMFSSGEGKW
jgi:hypothetical protein